MAVFAVFGQTVGFGFVDHDDQEYVYDNPVVQKGLTLKGALWALTYGKIGHWHPLTWLSHMADCNVYGLWAGGHHLTSVVLQALAAVLLFLALQEMTGRLGRSAFVAAVFAIHPLRVESVAWISERKDVLSGVFFMLTLLAYARYVRQPSRGRYIVMAVSYGLGLLCKNMLVTLPFVLLLLDWWPLSRVKRAMPIWGLIKEKIPLLLLSLGSCLATALVPERVPSSDVVTFLNRLSNAAVSYIIYIGQMVYPAGLSIPYLNSSAGLPVWKIALSSVLLAAISVAVWLCHRGRPYLLVGWLWYLGMLVPVIGLVQISYYSHADRYTYLPCIGLVLAGTWAVGDWSLGWKHRRGALGGLMAAVIGLFMICSWMQTRFWRNSEGLWTHSLACNADNYVAHNGLGKALLEQGREEEAIGHFRKAIEINPNDSKSHNNLGAAFRREGKVDEAMKQFQDALQINPAYVDALNNLGAALRQKGRLDEAISQYQAALKIRPDSASAHYNLGNALLQKGDSREAIEEFEKSLEIDPTQSAGKNNLAWLLATSAEPSLRDGAKAVELARQANALTGGENPLMLHTLAAALAESGRFAEAVETAQYALQLAKTQSNPGLAEALQSETRLYQAGRPFHSPQPNP